jgi:glycosyltransferase involved in cell wall biosynthesis
MRIAQIAPLAESCPPRGYGGTERIVSYLTEELVEQGHEVTLFASGDSKTRAELVPCAEMALRLNPVVRDTIPYHMIMLDQVRRRAPEFDVMHFHIDLLQFPLIHELAGKTITTLHGRLDLPDLQPFYAAFPDMPLASISFSQRLPLPVAVNWAGNVYHGLPKDLLAFSPNARGGYLAFLGRISPEKRPDRAIEIAARTGIPLKIAAKIDKVDREYWAELIEPMIEANPLVEYIGEIDDGQKGAFLGGASALLFPIDWPEPFGLVMIEAMACGTPVIAFPSGSVSEVIDEGETGYVASSIEDAAEAVWRAQELDRSKVRACFERRFTVEQMALNYLDIYGALPGVSRNAARAQRTNGHPAALRIVASGAIAAKASATKLSPLDPTARR